MFKTRIHRIMTKGKSLLLACDQGLEHGPVDFNMDNIDPDYILNIAEKGKYNAVIFQHGIAEKYYQTYRKKLRLVVKLNGKTQIPKIDPFSSQVCSIKRAVKLGADAVGYTIYDGSPLEPQIFKEFGKVVEEAHDYGLPVIAWMYPRGRFVPDDLTTEILAYSARIGLELGADFVKIKYNNDLPGYKWVVKSAGKTKVLVAGGHHEPLDKFLQQVSEIREAGAAGMAIGRNVWQSLEPLKVTKAVKQVLFENKEPAAVLKKLG